MTLEPPSAGVGSAPPLAMFILDTDCHNNWCSATVLEPSPTDRPALKCTGSVECRGLGGAEKP